MDWNSELLYNKAKLYCQRAHDEPLASSLFGFWTSLALELLARSALAKIHPVLLADPREPENIHYAFGVNPKGPPKSVPAKAVFARCSVLVPSFTDRMSTHCLSLAERRNSELHSGAAAFSSLDNSKWLPATYEVFEVLLSHLGRSFTDLLGADHGKTAVDMLADRRDSIEKEVKDRLAMAGKKFRALSTEDQKLSSETALTAIASWLRSHRIGRRVECPACGSPAGIAGETTGRSPVKIDESTGIIMRDVRVLPNALRCPACSLELDGYQELRSVDLGSLYSVLEEVDPIEYFGIIPEDYVDIDSLVDERIKELADDGSYDNE